MGLDGPVVELEGEGGGAGGELDVEGAVAVEGVGEEVEEDGDEVDGEDEDAGLEVRGAERGEFAEGNAVHARALRALDKELHPGFVEARQLGRAVAGMMVAM